MTEDGESPGSQVLPQSAIDRMTRVSTLLMVWEMLKSSVVVGVQELYNMGYPRFDDGAYRRDVASHVIEGKTVFDASVSWLVKNGAISTHDVAVLERIRDHRNEVALNVATYIANPIYDVDIPVLYPARDIIRRLGDFWGQIVIDENGLVVDVELGETRSFYTTLFDHWLSLTGAFGPNGGAHA